MLAMSALSDLSSSLREFISLEMRESEKLEHSGNR